MSGNTNILKQIDSIDFEDLYLVEKDLCFHEKVSTAFLLFADTKSNAEFILQKLLAIWPNLNAVTDILISYTKVNKNWKPFLVEALAIIKAKKVLRKLGFHQSDVRTHFLPHIPEISLYINPTLKALYSMCEMFTPINAGKLVLYVRDAITTNSPNDHLRFYNFDYLEIFLLDWITKRLLDASGGTATQISILTEYCKLNDMKNIQQMLAYSLKDLNCEAICSERKESRETQNTCVEDNSTLVKVRSAEVVRLSEVKLISCYKVDRESAGFVLIINQQKFYQSENIELKSLLPNHPLMEREGTDVDKAALTQTFSSFGYRPIIKDNLNHIDMLSTIRDTVKRSILYDSLIVCILTHGQEGSVYGCDSVPIKIDKIENILTSNTLLRKPKMLIIQACQGVTLQKALPVGMETDAGEKSAAVYSDMVKAMSTVPGFASLRNTKTGTWFIQTLCKKIDELGDSDHMLDILTEVNAEVGNKRGIDNECMTPISSQTLRKKFRLPNRLT